MGGCPGGFGLWRRHSPVNDKELLHVELELAVVRPLSLWGAWREASGSTEERVRVTGQSMRSKTERRTKSEKPERDSSLRIRLPDTTQGRSCGEGAA